MIINKKTLQELLAIIDTIIKEEENRTTAMYDNFIENQKGNKKELIYARDLRLNTLDNLKYRIHKRLY